MSEMAEKALTGNLLEAAPLLAVYNKPVGIHCTMSDPWGRSSLSQLGAEHAYLQAMHPVGRLGER